MGLAWGEVVVVGHEVDLIPPSRIVCQLLRGRDHEVGGERLIRADPFDCRALGNIEPFQRIRTETLEVQELPRVHKVPGPNKFWQDNFREISHLLCPEGCAPGGVEGVDSVVAVFAPLLESALSII